MSNIGKALGKGFVFVPYISRNYHVLKGPQRETFEEALEMAKEFLLLQEENDRQYFETPEQYDEIYAGKSWAAVLVLEDDGELVYPGISKEDGQFWTSEFVTKLSEEPLPMDAAWKIAKEAAKKQEGMVALVLRFGT